MLYSLKTYLSQIHFVLVLCLQEVDIKVKVKQGHIATKALIGPNVGDLLLDQSELQLLFMTSFPSLE